MNMLCDPKQIMAIQYIVGTMEHVRPLSSPACGEPPWSALHHLPAVTTCTTSNLISHLYNNNYYNYVLPLPAWEEWRKITARQLISTYINITAAHKVRDFLRDNRHLSLNIFFSFFHTSRMCHFSHSVWKEATTRAHLQENTRFQPLLFTLHVSRFLCSIFYS